jgi:hypothetical protein
MFNIGDDSSRALAVTVKQYQFVGAATHHNCEGAGRSDCARTNDSYLHDFI